MWNFHWNPHCGSMPNSYIQICPNKAPPCPPSWPYIPPCPPSWPYCGGQRATLSVCHRGIRKVFSNALLLLQLGRKQTYFGHKTAIANIYFFIFLHVTVFIFNSYNTFQQYVPSISFSFTPSYKSETVVVTNTFLHQLLRVRTPHNEEKLFFLENRL